MPYLSMILVKLRDSRYLFSINLEEAFWWIHLDDDSKEKTTFIEPGRGLFQFQVMPFGFHNAAQAQQRLVDKLFGTEFEYSFTLTI